MRVEKFIGRIKGKPSRKGTTPAPARFSSNSPIDRPTSHGTNGPLARPERKHMNPASLVGVSILFSLLLFGIFLVSGHGFIEVGRHRRQLATAQAEVSELALENERLEREVLALKTDPRAVEKIAREDLNLVEADDVVLLLPQGWRTRVAPRATPGPVPAVKP
ncbi:MAG: septum formation initiator family protein [Thermoanaerobaculia bacterium]